jgi:protease-4
MGSRAFVAIVSLVVIAGAGSAAAQPAESERFAEEPTGGVHLPTAGISGEVDVLTSVTNPAGLFFLDGWNLGFALDAGSEEEATGAGAGFGFYYADKIGGQILPNLGFGMALESLRPPRVRVAPDPGEPLRLTSSAALGIGESASIGLAWHHFYDSATLGGLDTVDLGLAIRGSRLGFGLVVRDLTAPEVAAVPVQRRYEAELAVRPLATDLLELGIGGRVGEIRGDIDGWLRGSVRLARGVYLRGEASTRELHVTGDMATGSASDSRRELRVAAGLELSFGSVGAAGYATTSFEDGGGGSLQSGTLVLRLSEKAVPSVLPTRKRIERIELGGVVGQSALTRIIAYLRNIERDDDVVAVVLDLDGFSSGWSTTSEIRDQLARLKAKGKKVYAFMVAGTMRQYYLASIADKIYLDPAGGIRLQGFAATTLYFKGVFDKLGVEAQFEKIEEYKSAPESWTRSSPSAAAFEMKSELYDSMYEVVVADMAAGRKLSAERVRALVDGGPYTAGDLEKLPELVDEVVTGDDLSGKIHEDLGRPVGFGSARAERAERWRYPGLAIIYINGDIVDGKSQTIPILGRQLVGGDTIAEAIAQARGDRSIAAIVLRINSPGGSALASELMAREVFKTRKVKPIICSMGNVAASGGYFAAAGCDKIFAGKLTITGSIGIFNGKFDVSSLLSRLGLSWLTIKRGESADAFSFYRPFTPDERALLKEKLRYYYGRFIGAVAQGRGMKEEEVDAVGRGRVWTGAQALPIKLIDQIGGLNEAIDEAKRVAGLGEDERVRIVSLPRSEESLLSRLLGGSLPGIREGERGPADFGLERAGAGQDPAAAWKALLPGGAGDLLSDILPASVWAQPGVVQARLPFAIVWE